MSAPEIEESLERFLTRVQPTLRATLARYSIPASEAEALLKDVLLTLVYKRDAISSPERWLLQTVRQRCLTFWRRRRWQLFDNLDSVLLESTSKAPQGSPLSRELDSIVGTLPGQCKDLLRDRYGLHDETSAAAKSPEKSRLESCVASLGYRLVEQGVIESTGQDQT